MAAMVTRAALLCHAPVSPCLSHCSRRKLLIHHNLAITLSTPAVSSGLPSLLSLIKPRGWRKDQDRKSKLIVMSSQPPLGETRSEPKGGANTVLLERERHVAHTCAATGPGGGVLDKPPPVVERPTPGRESEFDLGVVRKKKQSPPYRVLLHNDNFNRREYVVQVLMKVIPSMTVDLAVNIMQEAHVNGMAVVIVCGQDEAEDLCMQLRTNGLVSSIEPASS